MSHRQFAEKLLLRSPKKRLSAICLVIGAACPLPVTSLTVEGLPYKASKALLVEEKASKASQKEPQPETTRLVSTYICIGSSIQERYEKNVLVARIPKEGYKKTFVLRFYDQDRVPSDWELMARNPGFIYNSPVLECHEKNGLQACSGRDSTQDAVDLYNFGPFKKTKRANIGVTEKLTINRKSGYLIQESVVSIPSRSLVEQGKFHGFCEVTHEFR